MNLEILFSKSLINQKLAKKIINKYAKKDNWHNLDVNKANLGYGFVHYGLIRAYQPKYILCIGSRYGFIPAICALACKDNQKGLVDFVDAGYDQSNPNHSNHWGGVGLWSKIKVNKYFGAFKIENYLKLHVMTSLDFSQKFKNNNWDYIYLDGNHSYEGIKSDFEIFWPRLKKNGFITLHDVNISKIDNLVLGVHKLWKELNSKKAYNMVKLPGQYGLGLIQK